MGNLLIFWRNTLLVALAFSNYLTSWKRAKSNKIQTLGNLFSAWRITVPQNCTAFAAYSFGTITLQCPCLSVLINRSQNLTGILMSHLFWIHSQCLGNNATSCQKHICNPSTFSFYHLNKLQGPEIGFVLLKLKVTPPRAKVADYLVDRQYRA